MYGTIIYLIVTVPKWGVLMCKMDIQSKNFINIISAHLNGNTPEVENPDWSKIIEIADIHSLTAMLWLGVKDANVCDDENVLDRLKAVFNATVQYSVVQEFVTHSLIVMFNKNQVEHILFKGFVLRESYPCKELRTMGDIDIIIHEKDMEKVHGIMLENGFSYDEVASHGDVRNYMKNNVCYEIHTKIVSKNIYDNIDTVGYFRDNFKYAHKTQGFSYEFNYEHHLIYLLQHMANHFKFSGCGVRMLLDIPVFMKAYGDKLNLEYVENELKNLGLFEFCCNIFTLCSLWFGTKTPFNSNITEENINIIGRYIIAGGVFGYEGKNIDALRINRENAGFWKRFVNVMGLVFPSYEHLSTRYAWFKDIPKWMLPVGWVRFWWFRIVKNKENGILRVKNALKNNDAAEEHNSAMEIIGLNK